MSAVMEDASRISRLGGKRGSRKGLQARQIAISAGLLLDEKWTDRQHGDFPHKMMVSTLMEKMEMTRATAYRYVADYIVAKGVARRLGSAA